jgi:hypothetical protein
MIVPYLPHEEGGTLSRAQIIFNRHLSRKRMIVEVAFGWLKNRWRVLSRTLMEKSIERTTKTILACMIFHNWLIELNDNTGVVQQNDITPSEGDVSHSDSAGIRRLQGKQVRDALCRKVINE